MIVTADNNLFFDDTDSRCELVVIHLTANKKIAFVRCIDRTTGHKKNYCGLYDEFEKATSIENIMLSGAKFNEVLRIFGE